MSKISAIICSKDRPNQLNLLLTSINRFAPDLFDTVSVIWTCSNHKFAAGYQKLIERYPDVIFDFEGNPDNLLDDSWSTIKSFETQNFKTAFIENLKVSHDLVCPMVDDDVFWRPIDINQEMIGYIFGFYDYSVFSLRMGNNVRFSDISNNMEIERGKPKIIPYDSTNKNVRNLLKWSFESWGQSITLDGNIYKKEWLLDRCSQIEFSSPNFLEGNLQKFTTDFKVMLAPEISFLTSIPCNRVQEDFQNVITGQYTSEELNNEWLNNKEIDLDSIDFSNVNSTHCDIKYILKKV